MKTPSIEPQNDKKKNEKKKTSMRIVNSTSSSDLEKLTSCRLEPNLVGAKSASRYQFLRQGYFCVDSVDSRERALVFNRIVSLRDTWAKIEKAQEKGSFSPTVPRGLHS